MTIQELKDKANHIRDEVIRVAVKNKTGHIASSLSTVDILVALYYEIIQPFAMPVSHKFWKSFDGAWELRDRLVLSKGHGCYALYAILADLDIIPKEAFEDMGKATSILKGCVEYKPEWGLEASTGSLGHGLPMAVGMAYAAKLQGKKYRVYCIVGDGEMQEGSNLEALNFISEHHLDNIWVMVGGNWVRALDKTPLLYCIRYDLCLSNGHDMQLLLYYLSKHNHRFIRANTVKGYGLKCMESVAKFHYRVPTEDELKMGKTYDSKL